MEKKKKKSGPAEPESSAAATRPARLGIGAAIDGGSVTIGHAAKQASNALAHRATPVPPESAKCATPIIIIRAYRFSRKPTSARKKYPLEVSVRPESEEVGKPRTGGQCSGIGLIWTAAAARHNGEVK